jgi:hypothetical protein
MKCDNKICGKCGNMFCYITDVTHICEDEPIREIHFSCLNNNAGVFFPPYYPPWYYFAPRHSTSILLYHIFSEIARNFIFKF